jgi:hypothetical protein
METRLERAIEFTESFNNEGTFLGDDNRSLEERDNYQYGNRDESNESRSHNQDFSFGLGWSELGQRRQ